MFKIFRRSRSLDADLDARATSLLRSRVSRICDLEQLCKQLKGSNPLQQIQDYIDKLWGLIHLQNEEIAALKAQLAEMRQLAVAGDQPAPAPEPVGEVKGHEKQVLSHLQQQLQHSHIRLIPAASAANAAVTIKFHRMKPRLPNDELTSILAASLGPSNKLIVVFMHNVASGHEKTMKPAGPNNTDPGQWQKFARQCHATTNMTFDEGSWQWHDLNQAAARSLIEAIQALAADDQTS